MRILNVTEDPETGSSSVMIGPSSSISFPHPQGTKPLPSYNEKYFRQSYLLRQRGYLIYEFSALVPAHYLRVPVARTVPVSQESALWDKLRAL